MLTPYLVIRSHLLGEAQDKPGLCSCVNLVRDQEYIIISDRNIGDLVSLVERNPFLTCSLCQYDKFSRQEDLDSRKKICTYFVFVCLSWPCIALRYIAVVARLRFSAGVNVGLIA